MKFIERKKEFSVKKNQFTTLKKAETININGGGTLTGQFPFDMAKKLYVLIFG